MPLRSIPSAGPGPFSPLFVSSVALLTTFRRSGEGVATPVGIRVTADHAYFTTWSTTGKVKRLARNPQVVLAPCTRFGRTLGPEVAGLAHRLEPAEAVRVTDTLFKATLWGRLWDWMYRVRGRQAVVYEVVPAADPTAGGGAATGSTRKSDTLTGQDSEGERP